MASVQADELNIKINLDVQSDATKQIGKIVSGLKTLKRTVEGANKLESFAGSMNTLAASFDTLKDSKDAVNSITKSLGQLSDYLKSFDTKQYVAGLGGLNAVLERLGRSMENFVRRASGMKEAAEGALYIKNAAMSLNGIAVPDDAKQNLDKMADAIKRVSQYGTSFNNLTSGLKRLPEAIQGMNTPISDKAFETLRVTVSKLNTVLAGLNRDTASAFIHVASGIETLNKAGLNPDLAANMQTAAKACNDFIASFGEGVTDAQLERFYKLADALEKVTEGYRHLNAAKKGVAVDKASMSGSGIFASLSGLFGKIPGGGNFASLTASIGDLGAATSSAATGAAAALGIAAAAVGTLVAAYKSLKAWITSVNKTFDEHIAFMKNVGAVIEDISGRLISGVVAAFKQGISAGTTFVSVLKSIGSAAASVRERMGDSFGSLSKTIEKTFKSLTKSLKMIMNTLTRMTIRKAINAMFSELRKSLDSLVDFSRAMGTQFAESMDMFATSVRYLSNSLMAMFSPIINAVMPILDRFVDKLVDVINVINQFISFITGANSWTSAVKVPVKWGEEAEKAAKKQKKLNNSILAFDEINRLNGKDDQSDAFQDNPFDEWAFKIGSIDELFDLLAQKLSLFTGKIKAILSGINWDSVYKIANDLGEGIMKLLNVLFGDPELGQILGESLGKTINTAFWFAKGMIDEWDPAAWAQSFTNFIRGALDSLDWGLIQDAIGTLGTKFATYINDIFGDKGLAASIGTAIERAINTAIIGVSNYIKGLNWLDIGETLGTLFNNVFGRINYNNLFTTLADGINGVFQLLHGWLETTDFAFIANQILAGITAGFKEIKWFYIQKQLELAGQKIGEILNQVFGNVQFWSMVGTTIANGFNSAIRFIDSAIKILNWEQIGNALGTAFDKLINGISWWRIGAAMGRLFNGVFEAGGAFSQAFDGEKFATSLSTMVKNALDALDWGKIKTSVIQIAGDLGAMFNVFFSDTEMWGKIGETLGNMLNTAVQGLAAFLSNIDPVEMANSILTFFDKAASAFLDDPNTETALNNIIDWVAKAVDAIIDGWETSGLYDRVKAFLERVDWDKLFGAVSEMMVSIAILKMRIKFDMFAFKARVWIEEKFALLKGIIENFGKEILTVVNYIISPIGTLVGIFLGNMLAWFIAHLKEIVTLVSTTWNGIKTTVTNVLTTVGTTVSTKLTAIKSTFTNVFTSVASTVAQKFEDIKKSITDKITKAKDTVHDMIEKIKGFFNFTWSWPKLKMPHFYVSWESLGDWGLSIPHVSIDWYKKAMNNGMILNGATIFGVNSAGGLMGGGEAGSEAVVGTGSLSSMIQDAVTGAFSSQNIAAAVASGVAAAMGTADNSPTVDLTLTVDSETLYRMVRKGENAYNGRYRIIEGVT